MDPRNAIIPAAAALLLVSGCASTPQPAERARLTPADFAASARPPAPDPLDELRGEASESDGELVLGAGDEAARRRMAEDAELVPRVAVLPGPPEIPEGGGTAPTSDPSVLVDAKVGDISGMPIVASEFLAPLEGRLIAEASRRDRQAWRRFAAEQIRLQLDLLITDELLEAEARESLPTQVREVGLLSAVRNLRENLIRENRGSRELADARSREQSGQTLDERAEDQLRRQLITMAFRDNIEGRVHISRRDMELFYERNYDRFNPKPSAVFRRIRVGASFPGDIETVKTRLEAGEPFETVAALPINSYSEDSGLYSVPFETFEPDLDALKPFRTDELNEAVGELSVGSWVGPIETGRSVWWLRLERIDEPPRKSFYDAQPELEATLRSYNEELERQRFIARLREDASFTQVDRMVRDLTEIAESLYYDQARR